MQAALRFQTSATSTSARPVQNSRRGVVLVRAEDDPTKVTKQRVGDRKEVKTEGKVFKVQFLARKGDTRTISVPDNEYILESAEKQGLDLPATCRAGICGSCVARIAQGTYDQSDIPDLEWTINEEEQKKGMAMLCMTRACSDLLIETQSDWGYSLGLDEWKGATGAFTSHVDPLMGAKWSEIQQQEETVPSTVKSQ